MRRGEEILVPCTVVSILTVRTSLSTRGRNLMRWKAWQFSRTVISSSLPPAKKSQFAGSSDSRASCSYSNTFIGCILETGTLLSSLLGESIVSHAMSDHCLPDDLYQ